MVIDIQSIFVYNFKNILDFKLQKNYCLGIKSEFRKFILMLQR